MALLFVSAPEPMTEAEEIRGLENDVDDTVEIVLPPFLAARVGGLFHMKPEWVRGPHAGLKLVNEDRNDAVPGDVKGEYWCLASGL